MIALARDFVTAREAANAFGRLLDRARTTPTVITRGGKPAAVLIDPEWFDLAALLMEREAANLVALADAAAARADAGEALSGDAVRARLAAWGEAHGLPTLPPIGERDLSVYLDLPADDAPES